MKKKEVKYKVFSTSAFKKAEFVAVLVISVIFLIMTGFAVYDKIFVPLALIFFAMLLFSICCYYINDKKEKKTVYLLFSLGVIVIIIEVIYTLVNIV